MDQVAAGETARQPRFGRRERRRAEAVAVEIRRNIVGRPFVDQQQGGDHAVSRVRRDLAFGGAGDPPVDDGAMSQHGIDVGGDLRPVLGADVAPAAEIIGGDVVGRPPALIDRGENVDSGGDAGARGQATPPPPSSRRRPGSAVRLTPAPPAYVLENISCISITCGTMGPGLRRDDAKWVGHAGRLTYPAGSSAIGG
jgi:hypothetical protein